MKWKTKRKIIYAVGFSVKNSGNIRKYYRNWANTEDNVWKDKQGEFSGLKNCQQTVQQMAVRFQHKHRRF